MARNSANPTLQLGLISCKVGANPAVEKAAGFNNICDNGHAPVRTRQLVSASGGRLSCPECSGPPTGKGRETAGGIVKIDQTELDALAEEAKAFKGTANLTPHPAEQMTRMLPAPDGKTYMLAPYDASQAGNYALLLDVVRNHPELCFTTVWAVSTVPAMYRLSEYQDRLVLTELAWPDAVRELPAVPITTPDPAMAKMADAFCGTLVADFDPTTYKNTGRERLEQIIAAATPVPAAGGTATPVPAQAGGDLMAQLQAAVLAVGATPIESAPSKRTTRKPKKESA